MLRWTSLYSLLRRSHGVQILRCVSSQALHYAERVVHVENLPAGYNVSTILETMKAGTQVEKIQPQKTRLSVYFYDQNCAARCLQANGGSRLSLKIVHAEGRLPNTVVASLGRYRASHILSMDRVPKRFDIHRLQEIFPKGVESFNYNESDAQLEIRFLDTFTAVSTRHVLHEDWSFKNSLFDYVYDDENSFFPDWYPMEERNSRRVLKRSIEIRGITSPIVAETCQGWVDRFDEVSPALVSASLLLKRELTYLGFATALAAEEFLKMFQVKATKTGVQMELAVGDHTIHPSLITALSLGASRSLAFTLSRKQHDILKKKDCRRLFSRMGRVSMISVQFDEETSKGSLVVQFDNIFSAMGVIHRLMHLGGLPDLEGSHVNFKGAHQLRYLVI